MLYLLIHFVLIYKTYCLPYANFMSALLVNSIIICNNLSVNFLGISRYKIISSANNNNCILSPFVCILFLSLVYVGISRIMSNNSNNRSLCLNFNRNVYRYYLINYNADLWDEINAFCRIKYQSSHFWAVGKIKIWLLRFISAFPA